MHPPRTIGYYKWNENTMWMTTTTTPRKNSKPFIKLGVGLFISIFSLSIYLVCFFVAIRVGMDASKLGSNVDRDGKGWYRLRICLSECTDVIVHAQFIHSQLTHTHKSIETDRWNVHCFASFFRIALLVQPTNILDLVTKSECVKVQSPKMHLLQSQPKNFDAVFVCKKTFSAISLVLFQIHCRNFTKRISFSRSNF